MEQNVFVVYVPWMNVPILLLKVEFASGMGRRLRLAAIEDAQIKLSMEGFASDTVQKLRRIIVVMKDAPNMQRKEESVLDMVQKLRSRSVSSHEGYTNIVKKGGVCKRHGAKQKKCTYEVCTNNAQ